MARQKVVLITEGLLGGLRKHVLDLLRGLDKRRYRLTLVYSTNRADATARVELNQLSSCGIHLVRLPMRRGIAPLWDLWCLMALTRVLRKIRPHIVHCHGAKAGALGRVAARFARVEHVVYTPHGGAFHKFAARGGAIYLVIERLLSTPSMHFIGVSADSCRAIKRYLKPSEKNVHLVYNGIDLRETDRQRCEWRVARKDVGVPENRFVVLYPALFLEAKGHLEFLDVLARSATKLRQDVLVILAGEGPLGNKIARKIVELDLQHNFRFIGFESQLGKFYEICDLVLLPSTAEGFPYAALEAMAFSKPIIATAVGGLPEVVTNGYNGELVLTCNLEEIVGRLNYYSQHRREAERLGIWGRTTVEKEFTIEGMVAGTSRVYQQVLGFSDAS